MEVFSLEEKISVEVATMVFLHLFEASITLNCNPRPDDLDYSKGPHAAEEAVNA